MAELSLRCSLAPPSAKARGLRLVDFPIEKIIVAGPRVDLAPANLASEISRLLVCMLLPCRGVRHPAIGTAEIFDRPDVACHPAIMRRTEPAFQRRTQPRSMTSYSNPKILRLSDSVFLTPQILEAPPRADSAIRSMASYGGGELSGRAPLLACSSSAASRARRFSRIAKPARRPEQGSRC